MNFLLDKVLTLLAVILGAWISYFTFKKQYKLDVLTLNYQYRMKLIDEFLSKLTLIRKEFIPYIYFEKENEVLFEINSIYKKIYSDLEELKSSLLKLALSEKYLSNIKENSFLEDIEEDILTLKKCIDELIATLITCHEDESCRDTTRLTELMESFLEISDRIETTLYQIGKIANSKGRRERS